VTRPLIPPQLREDFRVVTYDHFMGTLVDIDRHVTDVTGLYPSLARPVQPVPGDLLAADELSGEMRITAHGTAAELLTSIAAGGGNLLIVGRPGSGKTTLLKQLVAASPEATSRRYRFFFDLGLRERTEPSPTT
jgi:Cdc6-like AAA superfamily ATPase